jgi:hypothetical protein
VANTGEEQGEENNPEVAPVFLVIYLKILIMGT